MLNHLGIAGKFVHREVNKAGLADILGEYGENNIQGEEVKNLDVYANEQFLKILTSSGEVCGNHLFHLQEDKPCRHQTKPNQTDFMQKGTQQVAAGYILYGSSTMMVYTTGLGVSGFTLDPSIGEFCLSHYSIATPKNGAIYSINEGYFEYFSKGLRAFLAEQAGGKATDGMGNRILEIQPTSIHQRTPFFVGSFNMVEKAEEFTQKYDP